MSILYNVHIVASRTDALMADALTELSPQDFALYSLLKAAGHLTPGDISVRHGSPASSTTVALQRLDARGHLERQAHPSDARTFLVHLTPSGEEAHRRALAEFMGVLSPLLERLGGDVELVRWALRRMASALAELQGIDEAADLVDPTAGGPRTLDYMGPELDPEEMSEVRKTIEYLLWQRER